MEKEKYYVIKCGKGYVRFNRDGSMISCGYSNAVTTAEYLQNLPFNVSLAVASGIILIEEAKQEAS